MRNVVPTVLLVMCASLGAYVVGHTVLRVRDLDVAVARSHENVAHRPWLGAFGYAEQFFARSEQQRRDAVRSALFYGLALPLSVALGVALAVRRGVRVLAGALLVSLVAGLAAHRAFLIGNDPNTATSSDALAWAVTLLGGAGAAIALVLDWQHRREQALALRDSHNPPEQG